MDANMNTLRTKLPVVANRLLDNYLPNWKIQLVRQLKLLGAIIALLWLIELFDLIAWGINLDLYGIHPRTWVGLRNVFLAPFLHYGIFHLLANTIPFALLGWFVLLSNVRQFLSVTVIGALVSGLGVWLLGGANTVHLGISGVIFGYMGFLLMRGYRERSPAAIALAVLAFFFYGGMLWSVLPLWPGVSWLGHLFGLVGGGLAAIRMKGPNPTVNNSLLGSDSTNARWRGRLLP